MCMLVHVFHSSCQCWFCATIRLFVVYCLCSVLYSVCSALFYMLFTCSVLRGRLDEYEQQANARTPTVEYAESRDPSCN